MERKFLVCSIKYHVVLEDFCNADWNTLLGNSYSTTSYVFTLDSGDVCWKLKKKTKIANSTMETKLTALSSSSEEENWLRYLLF